MRKSNFIRGSQVAIHYLRMLGQSLKVFSIWGLIAFVGVFVMTLYIRLDRFHLNNVVPYSLCKAAQSIGFNSFRATFTNPSGEKLVFKSRDFDTTFTGSKFGYEFIEAVEEATYYGVICIIIFIIIATIYFYRQGTNLATTKQTKGRGLVDKAELVKIINKFNKKQKHVTPYYMGGVPYPYGSEKLHTLIAGSTGSGKTVLISDLIRQIKAQGDKLFVFDKTGEFVERFYKEDTDKILNPFDKRGINWQIFSEVNRKGHFDAIAKTLLPNTSHGDPFWITAARTVFTEASYKIWQGNSKANNIDLCNILLKQDIEALSKLLKGTSAQSLINEDNPKTSLSIMSMLSANLKVLEYLNGTKNSFSIRDWLLNDKDTSSVFVTSVADMHATLTPILSVWFEIVIYNLLSLSREQDRKIWIILDELPALNKLSSLQQGLSEARKYGGCFILGIQSYSQLENIYGNKEAISINSSCKNKILLNAEDDMTATWSSNQIGRGEFEEFKEGLSYGANSLRDGVNANVNTVLKHLVLPSEFYNLSKLHAYMLFAETTAISKVEFIYKEYDKKNEFFVEREVDISSLLTEADDNTSSENNELPVSAITSFKTVKNVKEEKVQEVFAQNEVQKKQRKKEIITQKSNTLKDTAIDKGKSKNQDHKKKKK